MHKTMPMLLAVPQFFPPPYGAAMILGFGDVIVPGSFFDCCATVLILIMVFSTTGLFGHHGLHLWYLCNYISYENKSLE